METGDSRSGSSRADRGFSLGLVNQELRVLAEAVFHQWTGYARMMQPVWKGPHRGKHGSDEHSDVPVSTLPAGRRPPRSRPASAHERVYQPAGRSAAPLVRGAGVAAPRPCRRPAAVPAYGARRTAHPARARGTAGRAGAVPGGPGAAAGGGPPARRKTDPAIIPALEAIVAPETAGDPMRGHEGGRSSLRRLSERLRAAGPVARPPTARPP